MVESLADSAIAPEELRQRAVQQQAEAAGISARGRVALRALRRSRRGPRDEALIVLARRLRDAGSQKDLGMANQRDLQAGRAGGLSASLLDRLELTPARIEGMAGALLEIAAMDDPLGEVVLGRTLPNGIEMLQKRVPMGVVFTIYESRPNVTVDVGALCLKSGNAAILRGGKEALHTNRALHKLFVESLKEVGLPEDSVQLVPSSDRALMLALLQEHAQIDLVVPRGGEQLIQFVSANSRIPVVKHDKGVCNLYIDADADPATAVSVAINSKLHRTSVCNSVENLLLHVSFPGSAELLGELSKAGANLLGCARAAALSPVVQEIPEEGQDLEYATEYLDERLSVKVVDSLADAVEFIYRFGSGHTEAVVSHNTDTIREFKASLDSAAIFANCSTRFHDGGQMGFGAEVGISTGRLHVRGPMGLKDLTTTVTEMDGAGQVRD